MRSPQPCWGHHYHTRWAAGCRVMTDTTPDPNAVLAALGLTEATAITPVSGGWDTTIWRVEHGGATYALRLFRAEQTATCRREVLAMGAATAAGLPVPRVHAEGVWQARPALLLDWCPGLPLTRALQARPARLLSLGAAFGRMQAAVHAVRAPAGLAEGRPDWIAWAGPEEVALQARLRALALRSDALLHFDYHPLNVMADGRRISGVLDWANAAAGDPRANAARTFTLLRLAPLGPGIPLRRIAVVRRVLALGWRRGYEQVAGPVGDLALFHAWAAAVMLRDLAAKLGRPGVWLEQHHLNALRRTVDAWKQRAGLPG